MLVRLLWLGAFILLTTSLNPADACITPESCRSKVETCESPGFKPDERVVVVNGASGGVQWTNLGMRLPLSNQQATPAQKLRWELEGREPPENHLDVLAANQIDLDDSLPPITLVLTHNRPAIFRVTGNTEVVKRVILVGTIHADINFVGVTGVSESKVEYLQGDLPPSWSFAGFPGSCPVSFFLEPTGLARRFEELAGRTFSETTNERHKLVSWVNLSRSTTDVRLSAQVEDITAEMLSPLNTQIEADLSTYEKRQAYWKTQTERDLYGVQGYLPDMVSFEPELVHASMTLLHNDLPPFWHGLDLLRDQGAILVREDGQAFDAKLGDIQQRAIVGSVKNLEKVDAVLLASIERLPRYLTSLEHSSSNLVNGNYDRQYRVFVPKGIDQPARDSRDQNVCFILEHSNRDDGSACL